MRVRKKNASVSAATPRGFDSRGLWQTPRGADGVAAAAAMRSQFAPGAPPPMLPHMGGFGAGCGASYTGVAAGYGPGGCGPPGASDRGAPNFGTNTPNFGANVPSFLAALSQAYFVQRPDGDGWLPREQLAELLFGTARRCVLH